MCYVETSVRVPCIKACVYCLDSLTIMIKYAKASVDVHPELSLWFHNWAIGKVVSRQDKMPAMLGAVKYVQHDQAQVHSIYKPRNLHMCKVRPTSSYWIELKSERADW